MEGSRVDLIHLVPQQQKMPLPPHYHHFQARAMMTPLPRRDAPLACLARPRWQCLRLRLVLQLQSALPELRCCCPWRTTARCASSMMWAVLVQKLLQRVPLEPQLAVMARKPQRWRSPAMSSPPTRRSRILYARLVRLAMDLHRHPGLHRGVAALRQSLLAPPARASSWEASDHASSGCRVRHPPTATCGGHR